MSQKFMSALRLSLQTMEPYKIMMHDKQMEYSTNLWLKNMIVPFWRLETHTNFEIWHGNVYDVILGMQWLDPMATLMVWKYDFICGTNLDETIFEITSMWPLSNVPLLFAKQLNSKKSKDGC
jgi:hypothetical protein